MLFRGWAYLLAVGCLGCLSVDYERINPPCGSDVDCPYDWTCISDQCVAPGETSPSGLPAPSSKTDAGASIADAGPGSTPLTADGGVPPPNPPVTPDDAGPTEEPSPQSDAGSSSHSSSDGGSQGSSAPEPQDAGVSVTCDDYDDDGQCDDVDSDDDNDGVIDADDGCAQGELNWTSNGASDVDGDGCRDEVEDTSVPDCYNGEATLFISQYVHMSGSYRGIEIFNPTDETVDLSTYSIRRANGSNPINEMKTSLQGYLPAGTSQAYCYGAFSTTCINLWTMGNGGFDSADGLTFYGGNAVALYKGEEVVDRIGVEGESPASGWSIGMGEGVTQYEILIRKPNVYRGVLDWEVGRMQWSVLDCLDDNGNSEDCPSNYEMGVHTFHGTRSLFISEVVEGTETNKAIEIYNPTGTDVILTGYDLRIRSSATTFGHAYNLVGALASGDTLVVCHDDLSLDLGSTCDLTTSGTALSFDGDESIALFYDDQLIDTVGGTNESVDEYGWYLDEATTVDHTIRRITDVFHGNTSWNSDNWNAFPVDTFDGLGVHEPLCVPQ